MKNHADANFERIHDGFKAFFILKFKAFGLFF